MATVVTVLLTRGLLALLGYPQLGGGGLHVAHVLWGGLLMAVAFVLLLSFAGPVVRPVGALVGGVGFGLFIDEIGKFVTSDNDYFYKPTASLIYLVVVVLLLVAEALQGRRPPHASEALAGAVDLAVAGVAGGGGLHVAHGERTTWSLRPRPLRGSARCGRCLTRASRTPRSCPTRSGRWPRGWCG
ncbi:MAG: hypothetical protein H7269_02315 [Cellulomonas sp.]|nr:hypothetical protein [Cellulomonas sp.]